MKQKTSSIRLFASLTEIDQAYLAEAETSTPKKRPRTRLYATVAACLCALLIAASVGVGLYLHMQSEPTAIIDEIENFEFDGRLYIISLYSDFSVEADEYLGVPSDGKGFFRDESALYSVKGYDPTFLLCEVYAGKVASLFVSPADLDISVGRELYIDRWHLPDYETVEYRFWSGSRDLTALQDKNAAPIEDLLNTLYNGKIVELSGSDPAKEHGEVILDLRFTLQNGIRIDLLVFESGLVVSHAVPREGIMLEEEQLDALMDYLQNHQNNVQK